MADFQQIQISASSRGIVDHYFCFVCYEYKWDCDHLIDDRLAAPRIAAIEGSKLQSFAYDGQRRILEIEFRVGAPHTPGDEIPVPPPPKVIRYFKVPRYAFTRLTRSRTARLQERYWYDVIQSRYQCQTVRTVCRLPRIRRFAEARLNRYTFEHYLRRLSAEEQQSLTLAVTFMRALLIRALRPIPVAGLGRRVECQGCGSVGVALKDIRHRNCLWVGLSAS